MSYMPMSLGSQLITGKREPAAALCLNDRNSSFRPLVISDKVITLIVSVNGVGCLISIASINGGVAGSEFQKHFRAKSTRACPKGSWLPCSAARCLNTPRGGLAYIDRAKALPPSLQHTS
jgi:hypothetical protein